MTDTLTETAVTESLDQQRGPGVYALRASVPDDLETVRERWDDVCDERPLQPRLARLAEADDVAYVGESATAYQRLCEHANGERRTATFLEVFPPTNIIDVWWLELPLDKVRNRPLRLIREFNRAQELARADWCVWTDGEVVG